MRENYYFEYTIAEVSPSYRSKGAAMCINLSATEPFRIITKAAKPDQAIPQPVRTVTRNEIVPGVYGKVSVQYGHRFSVNLMHTKDEITAAIETVTQIRDAIEN